MNQRNKTKSFRKDLKCMSIDIKKFLIMFGLCDESILSVKISHSNLRQLFPSLVRFSYDYIEKNKNMIYDGNVILVKDSFNKIVPYANPNNLDCVFYKAFDCEYDKCSIEVQTLLENENLKNYELQRLCNRLIELRRFKEYRYVKRFLKKRILEETSKVKRYKMERKKLREEII